MIQIKTIQQLFPQSKKDQPKRLLAVFAHPDDESLNLAGVLAKAVKEGIRTYLVCLTRGEKGVVDPQFKGERLKKRRIKELVKAGKILGVSKVCAYGLPDNGLFCQQEKIKEILKKLVVKIKPGVIFTHDPSGGTGHPDHITVSLVVKSTASSLDEKVNLFFVVLGGRLRQIMKKSGKQRINWQIMPQPTHWLDIAPFARLKEKACLVHQSQQLTRARPGGLKVWFQLFDKEYFHLVDLSKKYQFQSTKKTFFV